jgi:hypothetical protein
MVIAHGKLGLLRFGVLGSGARLLLMGWGSFIFWERNESDDSSPEKSKRQKKGREKQSRKWVDSVKITMHSTNMERRVLRDV